MLKSNDSRRALLRLPLMLIVPTLILLLCACSGSGGGFSLTGWVQANPVLAVALWGVFTSVLSFVYNKLDQLPRVHAFLAILVALGLDLNTILAKLNVLVFGASAPAAKAGPKLVGLVLIVGLGAIVVPSTTGCGLLAKDLNFPADVGADEQCIYNQIAGGQTSVAQMATACGGLTLQLVVDLVEAVLLSKDPQHPVPPASVAPLQEELGKARALLAAQKAKAALESIEENRAVADRLLNYAGAAGPIQ